MQAEERFTEMTYPSLRAHTPVLQRADRELQVGLGDGAVIMAEVDPRLESLLRWMDGSHRLVDVHRQAERLDLDQDLVDWALRMLAQAGLLIDSQTLPPSEPDQGYRIRLVGAGMFGKPLAEALIRAGISSLTVVDGEPPPRSRYPGAGLATTQAEALKAELDRATAIPITVTNHWSKLEGMRPQLTIVASDTAEVDRVLTADLLRADQPHLVVRALSGGAVIGPLVVPGRSPCLQCMDLTRRDNDPVWPILLAQLSRLPMSPEPLIAEWAATTAVAHTLAYLGGQIPETVGGTVELTPPTYLTRTRRWSLHPGCGCAWGLPAQLTA